MATTPAHITKVIVDGSPFVLIPQDEFERLIRPRKPTKKKNDAVDAIEFATASIAQNIIRRRKAAGMSQKKLAEAAGIRAEVLNRAERAVVSPNTRTITKIDIALKKAGV